MTAPFLLDAGAELGLAIDEDSPRLGHEGNPLFEVDGSPTQVVSEARARLQRVTADVADAQVMVDHFAELRLVRPLTVLLKRKHGSEHRIEGLYGLGSRALAELSDAAVLNLYRRGYIAAAALMSASLNQMERLRQLHDISSSEPMAELQVRVAEQ